MPERTYSEEEMTALLERAAQLQTEATKNTQHKDRG